METLTACEHLVIVDQVLEAEEELKLIVIVAQVPMEEATEVTAIVHCKKCGGLIPPRRSTTSAIVDPLPATGGQCPLCGLWDG